MAFRTRTHLRHSAQESATPRRLGWRMTRELEAEGEASSCDDGDEGIRKEKVTVIKEGRLAGRTTK